MHYRIAEPRDKKQIHLLYTSVLAAGAIVQFPNANEESFIENIINNSLANGLIIVGEHPQDASSIVAVIHASRSIFICTKHVFDHFQLLVHPEFRGRKIGRTILSIFLEEVITQYADIGKIEARVQERNSAAIRLFQSLGFVIEGRLEMKIKNSQDQYEAEIVLSWQNPAFEF